MRKIIETVSTLILWAVFITGSSLAISEYFLNAEVSKKVSTHVSLVAWSPVIAIVLFGLMLVAIRFSKDETTKKEMPNEHAVQWSTEDLLNAQSGKVVDLHFANTGLACAVVTRNEVADILHSENQTVHVTLVPQMPEESARTLAPQRFEIRF